MVMMSKSHLGALLLLAVAAVVASGIAIFSSELNRVLAFNPIGNGSDSGFIIIEANDPVDSAVEELEQRGLERVERRLEVCAGHSNSTADYVVVFRDRSWRNGVVCLFVEGELVVDMSWWFDPFAP